MQEDKVRAKKHLGQHFLRDLNIAKKIATSLTGHGGYTQVLEIGPGMGVLTQFLVEEKKYQLKVIDIDKESIDYLHKHLALPKEDIIYGDFLKADINTMFTEKFAVIGNYPYNISSQIFFTILEHRDQIPESVGMIQKEVAERIAAKHGNKTYGILSVLLQAFYNIEYLFTVHEHVFQPAPKVKSAVIRLTRNDRTSMPCKEADFFKTVKAGFNNRRKTLRNALKTLNLEGVSMENPIFDKRAEQLSVEDFVELTCLIFGKQ
ncbi:MAG: 16S rRNA (adenine(1518)-N(6)/adenine(1519)-N(6))-dimethyltransferase RsmA [Cytophagaceae bacterium]